MITATGGGGCVGGGARSSPIARDNVQWIRTSGGLSINRRQLFISVGELSSSELGDRDWLICKLLVSLQGRMNKVALISVTVVWNFVYRIDSKINKYLMFGMENRCMGRLGEPSWPFVSLTLIRMSCMPSNLFGFVMPPEFFFPLIGFALFLIFKWSRKEKRFLLSSLWDDAYLPRKMMRPANGSCTSTSYNNSICLSALFWRCKIYNERKIKHPFSV